MAVDDQSEIKFFSPLRDVTVATKVLLALS